MLSRKDKKQLKHPLNAPYSNLTYSQNKHQLLKIEL